MSEEFSHGTGKKMPNPFFPRYLRTPPKARNNMKKRTKNVEEREKGVEAAEKSDPDPAGLFGRAFALTD
jgi:hypothetical protein